MANERVGKSDFVCIYTATATCVMPLCRYFSMRVEMTPTNSSRSTTIHPPSSIATNCRSTDIIAKSGYRQAVVGSCGFFVIWICYLGVNFLGKGLHSYGWVL